MNTKHGILLIGICLLIFCAFVGTASAKTIYVPTDYSTIQTAVKAAKSGDTIYVYNGTYLEKNIALDKSIRLIGESKDTTIIDGGGKGDVIYVVSNYCEVSGFTVRNSGSEDTGIIVDRGNDNIIWNNTVINNGFGIILFQAKNNLVYHNNLIENGQNVKDIEPFIEDGFSTNSWDNGAIEGGNYYDNYPVEGNPSDGSQPYNIGLYSIDHYPFESADGWLIPKVTPILTPSPTPLHTPTPTITLTPTPSPTPTPTPAPAGFEVVVAIVGLLTITYLLRRKK